MNYIYFKTTASLDDPETRKSWARLLSVTIEGHAKPDLPYMPNQGNDRYWVLDSANNWRFVVTDDSTFHLDYRYGDEALRAILPWLQYRFKVKVAPDEQFDAVYKDEMETVYHKRGVRYVQRVTEDGHPVWVRS